MPPPTLGKQPFSFLRAILNALNLGGLSRSLRSLPAQLLRLFLRNLYRCRQQMNAWSLRGTPILDNRRFNPLDRDKSVIQSDRKPDYSVIHQGPTVSLDHIATSAYPFSGNSIRKTSMTNLADPSRPGTPNSRLALSNRSVTSLNASRTHSPSPSTAPSLHGTHQSEPFDVGQPQIERQPSRNPRRQDSEIPGILVEVESPTSGMFAPGSVIEEEADTDLVLGGSPSPDPTLLGPHEGSAVSSDTQHSSRPSSRASSNAISWDEEWDLNPTFPTECLRYERRTKILKKDTDITMEPLHFDFNEFKTPKGWTRYAHPEGCCYFYNEVKRIYTDAELYDPEKLKQINDRIERVEMAKKALGFPSNADVVLNLYGDTEAQERQYFCLDHTHRVVFFFHEFHANWVSTWGEVRGAFSKDHWRYELESQYWYAIQMYPHRLALSKDMIDELRDIVLYFIGDTMSSAYSTSEFSLDYLQKILSITSNLKDHIESKHRAGSLCSLARYMFMLYHSRFLNFHGESYARIERNFSVYGDALYPRTLFLRSLSFLLFSAPDIHLRHLQKMWVDKVIHKAVWEDTLKKFSTEWQELVTSTTILLNANVAFLAIQSVDKDPPERSWAQIVSYASVISNVGGMILGLLLIRQHRNITQETSDHVHAFLRKHDHNLLGLETLAVMFSLPYALLMWGMVSFLAAFALMCLDKAGAGATITVSTCLGLVGGLIFLCIIWGWETNETDTSMDNRNLAYQAGKTDGDSTHSHPSPPVAKFIQCFLDYICTWRSSGPDEETPVQLSSLSNIHRV